MSKQDLEKWFNEEFWPLYLELVKTPEPTKYKAGTKGDALSKVLKEGYSKELRDRIIRALQAQIKHRRDLCQQCGSMQAYMARTAYDKFYCNRNGRTWLNQCGWEDEIPSIMEEKASIVSDKPMCKECQTPAHGDSIYCAYHYSMKYGTLVDELRDYYDKNCRAESGESREDYLLRMRQMFKQSAKGIGSGHI